LEKENHALKTGHTSADTAIGGLRATETSLKHSLGDRVSAALLINV
jgi:hypothetical protein